MSDIMHREGEFLAMRLFPAQLRHAVRFVASNATDAEEAAELLAMLGLEAAAGKWTEAAA